jgi:hypothetical protein
MPIISLKDILKHPLVYQLSQNAAGFFCARVQAIAAYLPMESGEKVVDIGCGPGFIVNSTVVICHVGTHMLPLVEANNADQDKGV